MLSVVTLTNRIRAAEERRRLAVQADCCVRWLNAQGFQVLRIEQSHSQPRIYIRTSPLCDKLEGTTSHFERGIVFERRYKQVMRFDCEIRWAEGVEK